MPGGDGTIFEAAWCTHQQVVSSEDVPRNEPGALGDADPVVVSPHTEIWPDGYSCTSIVHAKKNTVFV